VRWCAARSACSPTVVVSVPLPWIRTLFIAGTLGMDRLLPPLRWWPRVWSGPDLLPLLPGASSSIRLLLLHSGACACLIRALQGEIDLLLYLFPHCAMMLGFTVTCSRWCSTSRLVLVCVCALLLLFVGTFQSFLHGVPFDVRHCIMLRILCCLVYVSYNFVHGVCNNTMLYFLVQVH
jgi:hypothetical protein